MGKYRIGEGRYPDKAYNKIIAIAEEASKPYKAGSPPGVDAQWLFEGVSELLPIYDEIGDGCEVIWAKYNKKLKNIRRRARTIAEVKQKPRGFIG